MKQAFYLMIITVVMGCASGETKNKGPALQVCDLFQSLGEWDGKMAVVHGIANFRQENELLFQVVRPAPPDKCTFMDTTEPAIIELQWPDVHTLATHPAGYTLNESSIRWAKKRVREILKKNPETMEVAITFEGPIRVRKYLQSDISSEVLPVDMPAPVTLIVQSYLSVEATSH